MSEKKSFYVTTPIYYTNGIPHIGHSYSSFIADILARYNKISGKKVKFSTGVDENSQKIIQSAEKEGKPLTEYLDEMASKHKEVWDGLGLEYTDFIRTTEPRHHDFVRSVLQKSFDNGDIYEGEYEGMYCVGCEGFKKDDDLVYMNKTTGETFPITPKVKESDNIIKVCPDHLKAPDVIKEKNYFFKLSKYEDKLKELYRNVPNFVIPQDRFNEVIAFVDRGLEDFSISRETNTFGIKLPFDESQVAYVWYDALLNYMTVCQKGDEDFWPADLHVVGKDIVRFHAIYWPAMLMSAGFELPKNILTTGFFTVNGQKIAKSLGNAIDPVDFSEKYNKEMLILYLLSSFNIGQDGNFDEEKAILTYNAKLANNLGNLVNRVVVLALKLSERSGELDTTELPENIEALLAYLKHSLSYEMTDEQKVELKKSLEAAGETLEVPTKGKMRNYDLKGALDEVFVMLDKLNKYADTTEPWKLIKTDEAEARTVLYTLAEGLRQVGLHLYPFFPEKMSEMFGKLGLSDYSNKLESGKLNELLETKEAFKITEKGSPLFARFEAE